MPPNKGLHLTGPDITSMIDRTFFLVLSLCIPVGVHAQSCGNFPAPGFDGPEMRHFAGQYRNRNYGFAVTIPEGITGHDAQDPAPHHGFGVVLSWEPRAYIDFDGSYNALELSLRETVAKDLEWLRQDSKRVHSVATKVSKLGPLRARRQIVYHNCNGHTDTFVDDYMVALSHDGKITYTARLMTTASRYRQDRRLFEEFLRTWKLSNVE